MARSVPVCALPRYYVALAQGGKTHRKCMITLRATTPHHALRLAENYVLRSALYAGGPVRIAISAAPPGAPLGHWRHWRRAWPDNNLFAGEAESYDRLDRGRADHVDTASLRLLAGTVLDLPPLLEGPA